MNSPLGYAIGNWSEILECIELMNPALEKSPASEDLLEVTLYLAGAMLKLAGKAGSIEEGIKLSEEKLFNGECFIKFIELVKMQGGDISIINNPEKYPKTKYYSALKAEAEGFVSGLDALSFGLAAVNLGCGRNTVLDKIDYSASILLKKKIGDVVKKGDVICEISGETDDKIKSAETSLQNAITISEIKPESKSRILEVIY